MEKLFARLDCLRWFGVLLVVMSHTKILPQRGRGNADFFMLSEFPESMSLKENGGVQFCSIRSICKYGKILS